MQIDSLVQKLCALGLKLKYFRIGFCLCFVFCAHPSCFNCRPLFAANQHLRQDLLPLSSPPLLLLCCSGSAAFCLQQLLVQFFCMPSEHKIVATCLLAELGTSANVKNYKGWARVDSGASPPLLLPSLINYRSKFGPGTQACHQLARGLRAKCSSATSSSTLPSSDSTYSTTYFW